MAAFLLLGLGSSVKAADLPRSEYPRPQFERERWMNLNGTWTYTFDFGQSGAERGFSGSNGFDGKITVPFCPESSLSGVKYTDFIPCIWYQRSITVPETWDGKKILLNFGAVDYEATIYIDGKPAEASIQQLQQRIGQLRNEQAKLPIGTQEYM